MASEYTHRLTVCTPMHAIDDANQLALAAGESEADVNTFTEATHIKDGVEYSCISTVIKPVVAQWAATNTLPDKPWDYDKEAAHRAIGVCMIDIQPRPFRYDFEGNGFDSIEPDEEVDDDAS